LTQVFIRDILNVYLYADQIRVVDKFYTFKEDKCREEKPGDGAAERLWELLSCPRRYVEKMNFSTTW